MGTTITPYVLLCLLATGPALADTATVAVQSRTVVRHYDAYARVVPMTVLRVRALAAGQVADLRVVPGDAVAAGAPLARLAGPGLAARMAHDRDAVVRDRAALAAARQELAIKTRLRRQQLATDAAVDQARATVRQAAAALDADQAQLQAARAAAVVRTPVAGRVLALTAAPGEQVAAGQAVVTLVPAGSLWLEAVYYGADAGALHPGMVGRFLPVGGGSPLAVRVRALGAGARADGGQVVDLVPVQPSPAWRAGAAGTLELTGTARTLPAVPTRDLILDQGRWWVLVKGAKGEARRAVTPGAADGAWTLIRAGLAPGERVVDEGAYLEFHHGIAGHYQPPD